MIYHVYRPTIQGEKRWGYYHRAAGKKICVIRHPRTGKPFATRSDLEHWLEELKGRETEGSLATVEELSKFLFTLDGAWAKRQARRRNGRPLARHTLQEHELNTRLHIIPGLGKERVCDVDTLAIDEFLYSLDMSNAGRRGVAGTLQAILKEGVRRRIITRLPMIERPTKKSRKPAPLTLAEMRKLFPRDLVKLREVWAPGTSHPESPVDRVALAACAATMFFGGLRPQEARAAGPAQLLRREKVLLVTRDMDADGDLNEYVKKGDDRDPRYRGTLLIDWAMEILEAWLSSTPRRADFLFTYSEKPIRPELLRTRLLAAAKKAKIATKGRKIVPYSGRYTFNTTVKPLLPREVLMAIMGHVDEAMPDHYDMPALRERMRQLAPYREQINKAIG